MDGRQRVLSSAKHFTERVGTAAPSVYNSCIGKISPQMRGAAISKLKWSRGHFTPVSIGEMYGYNRSKLSCWELCTEVRSRFCDLP